MSDKYIKEITQNIPNNELNAAYDALMNSNLNKTSDYEEISMEELNEYIEGLECQAEDLRKQLTKANERVAELELIVVAITHADETGYVDDVGFVENWSQVCDETKALLNKFAIEQKVEAVTVFASSANEMGQFGWSDCQWLTDYAEEWVEQLSKEQE